MSTRVCEFYAYFCVYGAGLEQLFTIFYSGKTRPFLKVFLQFGLQVQA